MAATIEGFHCNRLCTKILIVYIRRLKLFSVEHASSMGPAVMEEGGATGFCLVVRQAVEFPQVLASIEYY